MYSERSVRRILVGLATVVGLASPVTVRAQEKAGELAGVIQATTKADGSVAVLTVDLLKSEQVGAPAKTNGFVDITFVIVRPVEKLTLPPQMGTIRLPSIIRQYANAFLDISFEATRQPLLVTTTVPDRPVQERARVLNTALILRWDAGNKVDHKAKEAKFFAVPMLWDASIGVYGK